jgi:hypothetical protein
MKEKECELFGNFGFLIQAIIGGLTIFTLLCIIIIYVSNFFLLVKRVFEKPKRSWRIFLLVTFISILKSLGCC